MATGRPTTYRPEFCEQVIQLGKEGKSLAQMACEVGAHVDTLAEWTKVNPDFSAAISTARQCSLAYWEDLGQKGAEGKQDVNAALWSRSMAARFPAQYTERKQTELSGRDGQPIEHAMILRDLPEDELTARIEAAMKAMGNG